MEKIVLLLGCCLLWFETIAQQRIVCSVKPSFDAPASIQIQPKGPNHLQLIFKQTGQQKPPYHFTWGDDTTRLVHVREMGRYLQQFAFSDTILVTQQEAPLLFKSFRQVYTQANRLSLSKDERLKVDGMNCHILVVTDSQTRYEWNYGPPIYEDNKAVHQLMQAIMRALKMKSENPATVNYCMIIDRYMQ